MKMVCLNGHIFKGSYSDMEIVTFLIMGLFFKRRMFSLSGNKLFLLRVAPSFERFVVLWRQLAVCKSCCFENFIDYPFHLR